MEKATFAAGCFWGVEEAFRHIDGVSNTRVGYVGGWMENPSYEDVCTDRTGHAEAVEIDFDPQKVSYENLLETFWRVHDPTTVNRQGPDIGTQYRSAIFFHTPQQQAQAQRSKQVAQQAQTKPIATEITAAATFYPAEDYHQQYLEKRGAAACQMQSVNR
jgi:peptide-methionine (S)-S-oxide reductase